MSQICFAPKEVKSWYLSRNLANTFDRIELRLPESESDGNKAAVVLECGSFLASFTVWGSGTTEWIVVNGESGETVIVRDSTFTDVSTLYSLLDAAIEELLQL
ncbi:MULTISPECIES: hypothetical protein [unclassified Methylocaldum]|jgi:hypothetical protein|uniref:hypothetical protein n=1 Tax=unclassified Methylocaldum TaxID=2622260 RepID=UPI00111BD0D9|nr:MULTISPECIES: hypothetical protein [unclassified Methylocaldum]MBP1148928.1 hypothetical protein [Methylocaldum sp. RMAD-M]